MMGQRWPGRHGLSGLYALTPDTGDTAALVEKVAAALSGGASAVQYRNKSAPERLRYQQAAMLRRLCEEHQALFIVNDDLDLAAAVRADGIHLGGDDASLAEARSCLGDAAVIGASCYDSLARAAAAIASGADYIAFGSFYPSSVKPDAVRADVSLLSAARARWQVPLVAIGGITAANAAPLVAAGADAVAVISALFDALDTRAAAQTFTDLFVDGRHRGRERL